MTLFVRVIGENGKVQELQAILDTGSAYVIIPYKDAVQLGYTPFYDPFSGAGVGVTAVTSGGLIEIPVFSIKEVRVGELVAENVEAVVYDLPEPGGVEAILGASFLKNFTVTIDYKKGVLRIE